MNGPSYAGSSPRRRGTLLRRGFPWSMVRFIPAQAGNTAPSPCRARPAPVHPRAGGEHAGALGLPGLDAGSSPRRRGTLQLEPRHPRPVRFIPAQAGNTRWPRGACPGPTVHPRAGGEHGMAPSVMPANSGSSPRRRGTLLMQGVRRTRRRFIPAQAGNTTAGFPGRSSTSVHPRAGGEHAVALEELRLDRGSSPRRRGTLFPQLIALTKVFRC